MKSIILSLLLSTLVFGQDYRFSFIGLERGSWILNVCESGQCRAIETEQEPRTYDYDFESNRTIYIASDKSVRLIFDGVEKKILESRTDSYTDPLFMDDESVILVELINGNSTNTKIISIDFKGKERKTLHYQHSTALNPYCNDQKNLYYANVSCVEGCGKIIQEIWSKNLRSKEAQQLTMLNTISHQPSVDKKGHFLYFSAYTKGNYHIWKLSLREKVLEQITKGDVTDAFPAPYKEGVFFLRREKKSVKIMHLSHTGNLEEVTLPKAYKKIRNLKVEQ